MASLLATIRETHEAPPGSLGHVKKIGKLVGLQAFPENLGCPSGRHAIDKGGRRDALVSGSPGLGVSSGDFLDISVGSGPNPHKTSRKWFIIFFL
jgi:hypothetical protein